jgi:hypothetical protein
MTARPFRLTPPELPEQELHENVAALCRHLVAPPAAWAFYPAGGVQLAPFQAAKLARMGLQRGWPDFLFLHDTRIFGIELKAAKGRLSKTRIVRTRSGAPRILDGQEDVFPRLEAAGMTIAVAHSVEEVLAQLEAWAIPLRGRIVAA